MVETTGERLLTGEDDTRALGAELAGLARPGLVVLLVGDLGAGKTTFSQGFCAALGVEDAVTSPTWALCNVYRWHSGELHHYDLYRLEHARELDAIGLEESVSSGALTLIEWPELALDQLLEPALEVHLEHAGEQRRVQWRMVSPRARRNQTDPPN